MWDLISRALTWFGKAFNTILDFFNTLVNEVWLNWVRPLTVWCWTWFKKQWESTVTYFAEWGKSFIALIAGISKVALAFIVSLIALAFKYLLPAITTMIKDLFQPLSDALDVQEYIDQIVDMVAEPYQGLFNSFIHALAFDTFIEIITVWLGLFVTCVTVFIAYAMARSLVKIIRG